MTTNTTREFMAVVALDGGGFVKANLLGVEPDPLAIPAGMRVRLTTIVAKEDEEHGEIIAPAFEPVTEYVPYEPS